MGDTRAVIGALNIIAGVSTISEIELDFNCISRNVFFISELFLAETMPSSRGNRN